MVSSALAGYVSLGNNISTIACHKSGETEEVHSLQLVRVDVSKRLMHQLQEELHVVRT